MKRIPIALFAALAILFITSAAAAATFESKLSGSEAVPAVVTKAGGEAVFKLSEDGKELSYVLTVMGLENTRAAHIHAGKKGEEGGPVVGLFGGPKKEGEFSGVLAKGTITDKNLVGVLAGKTIGDLVAMIKDGKAYVNVHTDRYPNGEIRGQIK